MRSTLVAADADFGVDAAFGADGLFAPTAAQRGLNFGVFVAVHMGFESKDSRWAGGVTGGSGAFVDRSWFDRLTMSGTGLVAVSRQLSANSVQPHGIGDAFEILLAAIRQGDAGGGAGEGADGVGYDELAGGGGVGGSRAASESA